MNGKKLNEMRMKGWESYGVEELHQAASFASATKDTFSEIEKEVKEQLASKLTTDDVCTFDVGSNTYSSRLVSTTSYDINVPLDEMLSLITSSGFYDFYVKESLNTTALFKDFVKGSLPKDIASAIVSSTQEEFKFSRRKKKGGE